MAVSEVLLASSVAASLPNGRDAATSVDDKSIPRFFELPLELPSTPVDPNEALADELRGRVMHIPKMLNFMNDWPVREVNQYYGRMKTLFDEALDR